MTARRLINASLSDNTRRAYARALGRSTPGSDGRRIEDAALAAYLERFLAVLNGPDGKPPSPRSDGVLHQRRNSTPV